MSSKTPIKNSRVGSKFGTRCSLRDTRMLVRVGYIDRCPFSLSFSAFYRQSLQIQHFHATLFHNATALRGINGPDDVQNMPEAQKDLAIRSINIALRGLDVTLNSPSYREGMKYGETLVALSRPFAAINLPCLQSCSLYSCNCDIFCFLFAASSSSFVGHSYSP
jgi:hypothetical protein